MDSKRSEFLRCFPGQYCDNPGYEKKCEQGLSKEETCNCFNNDNLQKPEREKKAHSDMLAG